MRTIIAICALLIWLVGAPCAAEEPFAWPDSYMVTTIESHKVRNIPIFTNALVRDHLKFRNQYARQNGLQTEILRLDTHTKTLIGSDRKIEVSPLPRDWPISNIFPRNRLWQAKGLDIINGRAALKYALVADTAELTPGAEGVARAWLSTDKKTPLRFEEGDMTIDFINYASGPQDPALFEVTTGEDKK